MSGWVASLQALRGPGRRQPRAAARPLPAGRGVSESPGAGAAATAAGGEQICNLAVRRRSSLLETKAAEARAAEVFREAWVAEHGNAQGWALAYVTEVLGCPQALRGREKARILQVLWLWNRRGGDTGAKKGARRLPGGGPKRKGDAIHEELWQVFAGSSVRHVRGGICEIGCRFQRARVAVAVGDTGDCSKRCV